jgi:hypothetical protein
MVEENKTENTADLRDDKGRFKEGNPGRPPGSKNYLTQLEEAIKGYEDKHDRKLLDRLIERAFISDNVLMNVIKKFIPDKNSTEITSPEPVEIKVIYDDDTEGS